MADIGYTEVQTAGLPCSAEDYAAAAREAGIVVVGTHHGFPADINDVEEYVNLHKILGTTNAGVGGAFELAKDKAMIIPYIEKVNTLGENLKKYGMKFTYHHHAFEFAKLGGDRIMDMLVDGLNPETTSFVLDTHWLQKGGVCIYAWLEKLAGRCEILHLKDYAVAPGDNNGYITECGSGNIDFKKVLEVAEATGVKHICVEQDTWPLGFDSVDYCMRKSFEHISQYLDLK
jgi:sugar phosphate isomerase/epimerase